MSLVAASTEVRPRALHAATMCEAFQITAAERAERVALRTIRDGISITYGEYAEKVKRLAAAFSELGVRRGDTVGFMLSNRPEFHLLDCAAMHLGAAAFSIYNTSSAEQITYLLGDAANRVMVVEAALVDRAREAIAQSSAVERLVVLDGGAIGDEISYEDLEDAAPSRDFDFEASWRAVEPRDILTLIYTSGTTGPPKGVQLTHANEMAECRGVDDVGQPRVGGSVVSFLPHAHIADRGLSHYGAMVWGHTVTCCPDVSQVFAHVADCRPTFFGAVPRVWEKLKAALEAKGVSAEADEETAAQVRASLGFEHCEWYMIGAAPAPLEMLKFFAAIGIPICEVWGMSETSSIATLVPPDRVKLGTVGPAIPGVEVRLASDGEVLVRGATIMAGYRNQPEKTAETIDTEGWLHTGDIGSLDDDGFLKIIDRKKELIINAAGKNMSPANIEAHLKSSSALIGQAVAIGDRRPYNVALIVLDPDACAPFAAEHGLADGSVGAMAREPAVLEEVGAGVERANAKLSRVEQIKRFRVLDVDWAPAGDELTPTMKLKRKPIAEKYAEEINELYGG